MKFKKGDKVICIKQILAPTYINPKPGQIMTVSSVSEKYHICTKEPVEGVTAFVPYQFIKLIDMTELDRVLYGIE
jgi:hypothetical protein